MPINISSAVTLPQLTVNGVTYAACGYSNFQGVTVDRPDQIAVVKSGGPLNNFFNTTAFARQALGTIGNARRYQVRGLHLRRGDLSLLKNIAIREGISAQLRVECFNITNTPNFANPSGSITNYSATPDAQGRYGATTTEGFGTITATAFGLSGRQFQFATRLIF